MSGNLLDVLNNHRPDVLDPAADRLDRARAAANERGIDVTLPELRGLTEVLVANGILRRSQVNDYLATELEQAVADDLAP